jgi:hypothetical protein
MSRVTAFVVAAGLLIVSTSPVSAQLGRIGARISGAVERKVDQRMQQEIDALANRMVDQAFDAVFVPDASSASGGRPMFNLVSNAPTESQYEFGVVITYDMQTTDSRGRAGDRASILMHFSKDHPYMGARMVPQKRGKDDADAFVIFDAKNESMVMLMESDGNKLSMAYGWRDATNYLDAMSEQMAGDTAEEVLVKDIRFTRIGTRKIAGYESDGYRSEDDGDVVEVWVSRDPAIAFGGFMGATASMKQFRTIPTDYPFGMMLEAVHTSKSGEQSRMTVSKIDTNARVRITMADYQQVGQAAGGR